MLKKIYKNAEIAVSVFSIVTILVLVFVQVINRFVFRSACSFSEELAGYLLVWLCYFSAAYTTSKNGHVRVDSVMSLYPERFRKYVDLLGNLLWLVTSGLLIYFGTQYTLKQFNLGSHGQVVGWLKLWVVYLSIPAGNLLIIIHLIEQSIRILKGKPATEEEELAEVEKEGEA